MEHNTSSDERLQQLNEELNAARNHLRKATKMERKKRGPENDPETIRKRIKTLEDALSHPGGSTAGYPLGYSGNRPGPSGTPNPPPGISGAGNPPPPPGASAAGNHALAPGASATQNPPSSSVNLPAFIGNHPTHPGYAKLLSQLYNLLMTENDIAKMDAIANREMGEDLQVQGYMASAGFNRAALGDLDYEDVSSHLKRIYSERFTPREESYTPPMNEAMGNTEGYDLSGVQREHMDVLLATLRFEADLRDISQLLGMFLDTVNAPIPDNMNPNQKRALLLAILQARADHRACRKQITIAREALHTAEGRMKTLAGLIARREGLERTIGQLSQLRLRNITADGLGVGGAHKLEIETSELKEELEDVKKLLANDGVAQGEGKDESEAEKPKKQRARKGEGKGKENHVPLGELTPEKQEEARAAGRKEIGEYLRTGDEDKISFTTRRYAREDPDFLPELAHLCYDLARTCFKTERLNYVCRTHQRIRGKTPSDGHNGLIQGVGFEKELGFKTDPAIAPEGHMNCGCSIEHALFDFFWWKAVEIHSTNPEIAVNYPGEKLRDDVIPCRTRSFMVEIFKKYAHLKLDDLFLNEPLDSVGYEVVLMARQLKSISHRLRFLGHHVVLGIDGEVTVAPLEA